jgi:hypothetical protein
MLKFIRRYPGALAVVAAAGLAAAGYAWAQSSGGYAIPSPTGAELVEVYAGSSPVINTVTLNQVRNTTGYLLTSAVSGTVNLTQAANRVIFSAALTGNITLNVPPNPPDGQNLEIVNGTTASFGANTITPTSTDGSTFINGGAIALTTGGASAEFVYTAASKVWYRMR